MGDPTRLYGLNALVLKGGSGIGEATARTLVKHGASVVAVDTANSGVERSFSAVKGITGVAAGLADAEQIPDLIEEAADQMSGLDILINDFPLSVEMPMDASAANLDALLQSRAALMTAACRACSRAEQDLALLTRELAAQIGEFGITANYVQPGGVMTPESRDVFRRESGLRDHCIKQSAARRLGEPVDIAKVVLFLASGDAVFVSGTGIAVDGGRTGD